MVKSRNKEPDDRILKALRAKGEAFMRMFEDADAAKPSQRAEERPTSDDSGESDGSELSGDDGAGGGVDTAFGTPRKSSVQPSSAVPGMSSRKAKRLFMSGKAALVHSEVPSKHAKAAQPLAEEEGLSRAQFRDIQREVGLLGATGLDKWSRKRFHEARLKALGAKPEKSPRIPANLGYRLAAKKREREEKEFENAVNTGMAQLKGSGKKKRRQKEQERRSTDRGLMEDGGAFRKGRLDLRLLDKRRKDRKPSKRPFKK